MKWYVKILEEMESRSNDYGGRSRGKERKFDHPKLFNENRLEENRPNGYTASQDLEDFSNKPGSSRVFSRSSRFNKSELADVTAKVKQINLEDLRISKLLRKLRSETDENVVIEVCSKLRMVIMDPANSNYIYKSFDLLVEDLLYIMDHCPKNQIHLISEIFGMMGFVIRSDFQIYKSRICKTYKAVKYLKIPMMNALEKTLKMDELTLDLKDQISRLMELLRDFLEGSGSADTFMAITSVILVIAKNYPKHFHNHFQNIVDIVVGWHLETEQTQEVKQHCSIVLQHFKTFFENDMQFTLDLFGQLLEDIDNYSEKIESIENAKDFGSHLCVCNTIFKCLFSTPEYLWQQVGDKLHHENIQKILGIAQTSLEFCKNEEILLPVNEFLLIYLDCCPDIECQMENIISMISQQFKWLDVYSDYQISSFLALLAKFIEIFKSKLPLEFLWELMNSDSFLVTQIRYHNNNLILSGLIKVYHEIFNIKNVPLLQEAYKNVLIDIGLCLKAMKPLDTIKWDFESESTAQKSEEQAKFSINFNLIVLSRIATTQNSIIAMYALQPSLLELLAFNLKIYESELWDDYEPIRIGILKLFIAHCQKNHNFVSSSSLFITKTNSTSSWSTEPSSSSQHFKYILEFIEKYLKINKNLELIVDWFNNLIQQTVQYHDLLKNNQSFNSIIKSLNLLSAKSEKSEILKCATCLDSLMDFETLHHEVLTSIAEICCVHICSVWQEVRNRYSLIFSKLPLQYCLEQANYATGINKETSERIYELEHWHLAKQTVGGDLKSQCFKEFIDLVANSKDPVNLEEICLKAFESCWYLDRGDAADYCKFAMRDIRNLISWIQWEAAQFCVNNKLRTPLGKPHETFVKIETIIREHAKILALKDQDTVNGYEAVMSNQKNSRILLGFMEALEKAIYNASDGNAFGIPAPEKPARTFFRLNTQTCNEWFSRNRTAVDLIALHNMELEMVIRYSESVLKDLVVNGKTEERLFDHILMSLVWALLRNYESDALIGLYNWIRKVTGKKYLWIKMAADQADGRR